MIILWLYNNTTGFIQLDLTSIYSMFGPLTKDPIDFIVDLSAVYQHFIFQFLFNTLSDLYKITSIFLNQ